MIALRLSHFPCTISYAFYLNVCCAFLRTTPCLAFFMGTFNSANICDRWIGLGIVSSGRKVVAFITDKIRVFAYHCLGVIVQDKFPCEEKQI